MESQTAEIIADPFPLTAFSIHLIRSTERPSRSEEGPSEPHDNNKSTMLGNLPSITTTELNDESKGDIFVKRIAISEMCWVAFANHRPIQQKTLEISQLQLAVAAFSACATFHLHYSST